MTVARRVHTAADAPELARLTVAEYDAMGTAGVLTADDRVELLEGRLVPKVTKNPPHRIATACARDALAAVLPSGWYVDTQEPIVTGDSEPEPDVCVLRGRTKDYAASNPPASAVGLVVEVADTTLESDRSLKAGIYARAGIPTYWLVNLVDRVLEVYTRPAGASAAARYESVARLSAEGRVVLVLDGGACAPVLVAELLP